MEEMFSGSSLIVVENKADFKKTDSTNLKISCKTGEGIDSLVDEIFLHYMAKDVDE